MKKEFGSNYASIADVNFTAKYRASCLKYVIVWHVKNCMEPQCNGQLYFTNMTSELRKALIT
ncbi:MAG: hypothetical protein JRF39_04385 [Deltaproteobacteria bacterium]|nr:hypothetical protein [Deltaproteobacteria bacterium]